VKHDDETEAEVRALIARARGGDRAAQERLIDLYRPRLYLSAERRLGARRPGGMSASDVVQEALTRAAQHMEELSGETRPELEAWLQQILRRTILRATRDAGRQKRDPGQLVPLNDRDAPVDQDAARQLAAPQATPSQIVSRKQEWLLVLRAISALPPGQREAVGLRHIEDRPLSEIARRLGRSELAVAGLIRRGVEAVRQQVLAGGEAALDRALFEYLTRRERGEVDRERFLAEHPDCAEGLCAYLAWADELRELARGD
jgi:RNA polymerase sigma-70 factor (ECF subfamily)